MGGINFLSLRDTTDRYYISVKYIQPSIKNVPLGTQKLKYSYTVSIFYWTTMFSNLQ